VAKPQVSDADTAEKPDIVTIAAETLMGDLRDFILDRLKHEHQPIPWNMRGEDAQRETISRTESAVRTWVHKACTIIAAGGQQAARGSMVKFQAKDGIQMQINIAASDALRHDLMDHVGGTVLVIIADADKFQGERAAVKVVKDQKDILDDNDDQQEAAD
jgi:hypothetical protein